MRSKRSNLLWKKRSDHLVGAILSIFLAYASWYGAESLGQRSEFNFFSIEGVTAHGLINAFVIFLLSSLFIFLLIPIYRVSRIKRFEWFALCFLLLNVLNFSGPIHKHYLIGVENSIFLTILLLSIVRRKELAVFLGSFQEWGPLVQVSSYTLALLLPLVIHLNNSDYSIWKSQGVVDRYLGWLGLATYIGFLGLSVLMAGGIVLFYRSKEIRFFWLSLFMISMGYIGIQLAVLRIAMLAAAVFFFVGFHIAGKEKHKTARSLFLFFGVVCLLSQYFGKIREKNMFLDAEPQNLIEKLPPEEAAKFNPNNYLQTNGRALIFKYILKMNGLADSGNDQALDARFSKEEGVSFFESIYRNAFKFKGGRMAFWIGQGTGGTSRFMSQNLALKEFGEQPHSDYLRVLGDHGLIGLILIFCLGVSLIGELKSSLALGVIVAFALCMLTDNIMVLPIWGYGPMFVSALFVRK